MKSAKRIAEREAQCRRLLELMKERDASGKKIDPFFVAYLELSVDRLEELFIDRST